MAVNVPLPVGNFGIADWKDYDNNWRELDAEWLRDRAVMRFATTATRNTAYPTPGVGQVVYNDETGVLELYKAGAWQGYRPLPVFTKIAADTASQVVFEHSTGAGKGLTFTPTGLTTGGPLTLGGALTVLTNALIVDATGLSLKVGAITTKLTTDATGLVSDKQILAPKIVLNGTGTVIDAGAQTIVVGTVTAGTVTASGNVSITGNVSGTFTGTLNSTNGGVAGGVTLASNFVSAPTGFVSSGGYFYGSATQASMRQRLTSSPFTLGAAGVDVTSTIVTTTGTDLVVNNQTKIYNNNSIDFYGGAPGSLLGHAGPVVYSSTTPTVANYPEGTIWVQP